MSQSSPEGIILGKGSKLVSLNLLINDKEVLSINTKKTYTEEDMINASKYGYEFHKTTSFPNQEFKDSCVNNTKQWLTTFNK